MPISFSFYILIATQVILPALSNDDPIPVESPGNPATGPFALKDALMVNGKPNITDAEFPGTEWFILRQSLTWGEAAAACERENSHLVVLPKLEHALQLVKAIADKSEPYTPEYDQKIREVELGMDRRYWIGLTDQVAEGRWMWVKYGKELEYNFWYPTRGDHFKKRLPKHCAALWNPGYYASERNTHTFTDEFCTKKYYAICDKSKDLDNYFNVDQNLK